MVSKKHPNLSIFCFYMICLASLVSELSIIEVCVFTLNLYLVGKKCQPQYKNNGKTKFLEAYNSETKSHTHIVSIYKALILMCSFRFYQPFLTSFEIVLMTSWVNGAIVVSVIVAAYFKNYDFK